MEELYGLYGQTHVSTAQLPSPSERDFQALELPTTFHDRVPPFGSGHYNMLWTTASASAATMSTNSTTGSEAEAEETSNTAIRAKIVSHPLYPKLLHAYIDCHKVGAPPDIANVFDEIFQEKDLFRRSASSNSTCFGDDPQLDEFMESYCEVLMKYKTNLSRPFNEATTFLNNIETKLSTLCSTGTSNSYISEEVAGSSEEEYRSSGEVEVQESNRTGYNLELKDNLLRKYSGYICSLKNEFSIKKKKGKLPKEARQLLLEWWNIHYKWPYPTEGEKVALAESTGLDQKQINNWFINQRKRHWKPSENMQFAVMDSLYGPLFMNN